MLLTLLLSNLDFSLPLKNPVVIFSLVLFIILFAPIIFHKIKIPHIIGLILAGVAVGPHGANLLTRDSSIVLFGTVGLLYIMFLAGLEIDLKEFKKNKNKILVFGMLTFLLPLIFGSLASYYILGYSLLSSLLLASMFSTHTLVSYPIASKHGVIQNRAVTLTVGGTMITDILALLILAAITGLTKEETDQVFWIQLSLSCLAFVAIVFFLFPIVIRWFFKRFNDSVSQYIFVLAMVFLASFMAEAAGVEAIIGAFFSGLVLNRFIPHSSPLMNRINFVGNALFIPFFLIGVGMLVDVSVLFKGLGALRVAGVIVFVALITKFLAALITQKIFSLSRNERNLIFGLSASHAAATLAIILVGYNIIIGETENGQPIRLLDEDVLNGTILLILISCGVSSFVTEKESRILALKEDEENQEENQENILISLNNPDMVPELVDLSLMLKPKRSSSPIYALHIVSDEMDEEQGQSSGKKMLSNALRHASATESKITPITRHDSDISNGLVYTIREKNITDVIIALPPNTKESAVSWPIPKNTLSRTFETIFIYKAIQPFNTLKRIVITVNPLAEQEPGFEHWLNRVCTLSKESGLAMIFYTNHKTGIIIKALLTDKKVTAEFREFSIWDDFLIFKSELKANDLFLVISSRKGNISYQPILEKLSYYLLNYFNDFSFILLYPKQSGHETLPEEQSYFEPGIFESITDKIDVVNKAGSLLKRIFRK